MSCGPPPTHGTELKAGTTLLVYDLTLTTKEDEARKEKKTR
jgi:hypothetical protein